MLRRREVIGKDVLIEEDRRQGNNALSYYVLCWPFPPFAPFMPRIWDFRHNHTFKLVCNMHAFVFTVEANLNRSKSKYQLMVRRAGLSTVWPFGHISWSFTASNTGSLEYQVYLMVWLPNTPQNPIGFKGFPRMSGAWEPSENTKVRFEFVCSNWVASRTCENRSENWAPSAWVVNLLFSDDTRLDSHLIATS